MNNELMPINGLWYRIKNFFRKIFFKEKIKSIKQDNSNFVHDNTLKEKFEKESQKQALAEKLLYGEIGTNELNEREVDEMIQYFKKDIENMDIELLRIKKHILSMQQQLKD